MDKYLHLGPCPNSGQFSCDLPIVEVNAEASVRNALHKFVVESKKQQPTAISEFWVPQTHERADLALIGRELNGFEIKTERDTLRRLPRQSLAYARVFDRCTVVVAPRHTAAAMDLLPEWWGVFEASVNGHVEFNKLRAARQNLTPDPETLVRLLWRSEVKSALNKIGIETDPKDTRGSMWRLLLNHAELRVLRSIVRGALRRRGASDSLDSPRRTHFETRDNSN